MRLVILVTFLLWKGLGFGSTDFRALSWNQVLTEWFISLPIFYDFDQIEETRILFHYSLIDSRFSHEPVIVETSGYNSKYSTIQVRLQILPHPRKPYLDLARRLSIYAVTSGCRVSLHNLLTYTMLILDVLLRSGIHSPL